MLCLRSPFTQRKELRWGGGDKFIYICILFVILMENESLNQGWPPTQSYENCNPARPSCVSVPDRVENVLAIFLCFDNLLQPAEFGGEWTPVV